MDIAIKQDTDTKKATIEKQVKLYNQQENLNKFYPIAEMFFSTQGEGLNTGRAMVFIRLAGCSVGKRYAKEAYEQEHFPIWQNECTSWDGRSFACDTDYRVSQHITVGEIIDQVKKLHIGVEWISITGGEPLIHDLSPLLEELKLLKYKLHLETSGTIDITDKIYDTLALFDHIVVSPKKGFKALYLSVAANEVRIVLDSSFDIFNVPDWMVVNEDKVWLSPINFTDKLDMSNVKICLELQKLYPAMRISLQIHKILNVR